MNHKCGKCGVATLNKPMPIKFNKETGQFEDEMVRCNDCFNNSLTLVMDEILKAYNE